MSASLPLGAAVVHRLRVERAVLLPPSLGSGEYRVEATVENAGNVPEPASEARVVLFPSETVQVFSTPPLAAGERAAITATVTLPASPSVTHRIVGVYQRPAAGQRDTLSNVAGLRFITASAPEAAIAYFQLPGDNLIADAPWRSTRGVIPLMIFYARVNWLGSVSRVPVPEYIHVFSVLVRNPNGPASGTGPVVYENFENGPARTPADPSLLPRIVVRDEDGMPVESQRILPQSSPPDGTHRLLWIPTEGLPNRSSRGLPDPAARGAFLEVDFIYWNTVVLFGRPRQTRKMLGVEIGDALPALSTPGRSDRYYDAHFHSIAEWYTGSNFTGPAKAYGGPLEMLLATAWSIGFVGGSFPPAWVRDSIITTDHNTYFGDLEAPLAGPSQTARWSGASGTTGSAEMNLYRALIGRSAGEEVSLEGGGLTTSGRLGRHTLLYNADRHIQGDWGALAMPSCTPNYRRLLLGMSGRPAMGCYGQALFGVGGFTFAAHPFSPGFVWIDSRGTEMLRDALSLPAPLSGTAFAAHNNHDFVFGTSPTDRDGDFVFRGYQWWNARPALTVSSQNATNLRDINPYVGSTPAGRFRSWQPTCAGSAGYRAGLQSGARTYLNHVRDGLIFNFSDDDTMTPRRHLMRKLFFVGGSDAHGDFDYSLDLLATVVVGLVGGTGGTASVMDSAWGRPRTYVFGGTLEDMRRGRSIATDGPVMEVQIDAEARGHWTSAGGLQTWHGNRADLASWLDADPTRFDPDGQIGGDGRYDGSLSALVPYVGPESGDLDSQAVMVRTRCQNSVDFGGTTPSRLELLLTGRPGSVTDPVAIPLTPQVCDGAWRAQSVTFPGARGLDVAAAMLAHAEFGSGCPGTYEVYTNPVWLATVRAVIPVHIEQSFPATRFNLSLEAYATTPIQLFFPISMERQELSARIMQVADDGSLTELTGGTDNRGGLALRPTAIGWGSSSDGMRANTSLRLTIPQLGGGEGPINGDRRAGALTALDERFVLLVERGDGTATDRRLRDAFGNPLGIYMIRFKPFSSCNRRVCSSPLLWCSATCFCQMGTCPPR